MRNLTINDAYRYSARVALGTAIILLLPFFAMQFTEEVVWNLADFAVAGILLFSAGFSYAMIARHAEEKIAYRVATGVAVAAILLLVWVNLAVGLIGTEDNPANLMYIGVIAVGIVGAMIARLRSRGMALALFMMALAQALVAIVVLVSGVGLPSSKPLAIVFSNGIFIALFAGSGWLFLRASHGRPGPI